MRRISFLLLLFALPAVLFAAKPPTDEQLKNFCREACAAMMNAASEEAKQEAFMKEAEKLAQQADISAISPEQVTILFESGGVVLDASLRRWIEPILVARSSKAPIFAYLRWRYMPENDGFIHGEKETQALLKFLSGKNLQQTIDEHPGTVDELMAALSTMKDTNWHVKGFPEAVARLLTCSLPDPATMECVKVFNSIARVDTIESKLREQIRTLCRDQYEQLKKKPTTSSRKQKACEAQMRYLDGPFARGTLVGSKAPELHFLSVMKCLENGEVQSIDAPTLDAFKGKVVLLDFWATKCVPCLKAFPELAEIQRHFEGKEVVVIGVTSLQGYFVDTPHQRTIQCQGDPEKERSLFPDFMKGMGINWTIAISQEDVMNTDYGALAIPHVVIIDKEGIVRHNAVNGDKETKIKLIEQML
ncbi:MAG: TlpA family protein disulfide reductase [Bacteroidales bacterium]|nr:TlpA family protein disulfide reductase [Candidatus Physcousia equi]